MTLSEFRSWLSGFEEAVGTAPTEEQWAKIKAKLETVGLPGADTWPSRPQQGKAYTAYGLADADGRVLA